jgi:hypothetical protein
MQLVAISPTPSAPAPVSQMAARLNLTAVKTQTLWIRFLEWIGHFIRDAFYMPISSNPKAEIQIALQREEEFAAAFWDSSKPLDLNFPDQEKIRNEFDVYDQPIKMQTADGKPLELSCRVIESKRKEEKFHNFVHVLGNLSTISNNISTSYPYLAAYLNRQKTDPSLPPARFILFSQYGMSSDGIPFRPRSLDEAGLILKKALETLSDNYGPIDQLIAISLGAIIFASTLKHFEDDGAIPKAIHFDRAPSSIKAASQNYTGGTLLYLLSKPTGWTVDVGQELADFCQRNPHVPCIVSGVKDDYYFPGPAGLHEDQKIKGIDQVKTLVFAPPHQLFHARAHHGLRSDFLNFNYLVGRSDKDLLKEKEHLAHASLRHAFTVMKTVPQALSA